MLITDRIVYNGYNNILFLELLNPVCDSKNQTLVYDVISLNAQGSILVDKDKQEIQNDPTDSVSGRPFGMSTLVIDSSDTVNSRVIDSVTQTNTKVCC